ncbi:hypothetical protein K5M33_17410, partial [Chromobacterium vaccinii]|nr:hypothetical protein [Chromobacterium vaccinii]MBX9358495.1 hypothetical protein [Chromobacterium vaccinii]
LKPWKWIWCRLALMGMSHIGSVLASAGFSPLITWEECLFLDRIFSSGKLSFPVPNVNPYRNPTYRVIRIFINYVSHAIHPSMQIVPDDVPAYNPL